jgi:hypothetical protein
LLLLVTNLGMYLHDLCVPAEPEVVVLTNQKSQLAALPTSVTIYTCTYIDRIMSARWGFPSWAAAAFMRALMLRLTE